MSSPGRSAGPESLASSPEGNIPYTGSGFVTEELSRSCGRGLMYSTSNSVEKLAESYKWCECTGLASDLEAGEHGVSSY